MRIFLALLCLSFFAETATAAKFKKHPNHDNIVYHYHRLCDNFVDNEYFGATRAQIKKFCRTAAGYMRKTGDLPSYKPKKTVGAKKRKYVKPAKPEGSFNCVHLGIC